MAKKHSQRARKTQISESLRKKREKKRLRSKERGRKAKAVMTVEMQSEEGDPLADLHLDADQYDFVQRLMKEQNLTMEDAINQVVRKSMNEMPEPRRAASVGLDVHAQMAGAGRSTELMPRAPGSSGQGTPSSFRLAENRADRERLAQALLFERPEERSVLSVPGQRLTQFRAWAKMQILPSREYLSRPENYAQLEQAVKELQDIEANLRPEDRYIDHASAVIMVLTHPAYSEDPEGDHEVMSARLASLRSNLLASPERTRFERRIEGQVDELAEACSRRSDRRVNIVQEVQRWGRKVEVLKSISPSARSYLWWLGHSSILIDQFGFSTGDTATAEDVVIHPVALKFLREARIFHLDPEQVKTLFSEVLCTLWHLSTDAPLPEQRLTADAFSPEQDAWIVQESRKLEMGLLPYPVCYLGFGEGLYLHRPHEGTRRIESELDGPGLLSNWCLLGLLVGPDFGIALSRSAVHWDEAGEDIVLFPSVLWDDEEWFGPLPEREGELLWSILRWIAVTLIDTINSHRTLVLEGEEGRPRDERAMRKLMRSLDLKLEPKPFFTAELRSRVYLHAIRRLGPVRARRKQDVRRDRRAHERCLIRRGPLPSTAAEKLEYHHHRKKLVSRGYTVYDLAHPTMSAVDVDRLSVRGMPKRRPSEWLAILAVDVRHTVTGPEDAPYVARVDVIRTTSPLEHP